MPGCTIPFEKKTATIGTETNQQLNSVSGNSTPVVCIYVPIDVAVNGIFGLYYFSPGNVKTWCIYIFVICMPSNFRA